MEHSFPLPLRFSFLSGSEAVLNQHTAGHMTRIIQCVSGTYQAIHLLSLRVVIISPTTTFLVSFDLFHHVNFVFAATNSPPVLIQLWFHYHVSFNLLALIEQPAHRDIFLRTTTVGVFSNHP